MVLHKDIRDDKDAVKLFQILLRESHVFLDRSLQYRLQVFDALVNIVILRDIKVSISYGVPQDVLFVLVQ